MGLKSTFKKFFDLDDDLDEVLKDAFSKGSGVSQIASQSRPTARSVGRKPFVETKSQQPNVVNLKSVHQPSKVMLIEPQGFNDVQSMTDHLKHGRPVVFNLHHVSMSEAKLTRLFNFSGVSIYTISPSWMSYLLICPI